MQCWETLGRHIQAVCQLMGWGEMPTDSDVNPLGGSTLPIMSKIV